MPPQQNDCRYDQTASGITIYAYVEGNPILRIDSVGLNPAVVIAAPVVVVGAGAATVVVATGVTLLAIGIGILCITMASAGRWSCKASCNVAVIDPVLDGKVPGRVTGTANGKTEHDACIAAKRAATQSAPKGTYARHCQCSCSKR
jgi:hypothetical protein